MRFLSRILAAVARSRKPQEIPAVVTDSESEFIAEVVRITEVLPHPNADKLDVIHFERASGPTAYTVVDRKGRRVGDLVGYVGVDSLLPTKHPEFKFLTEREDGKGKAVFRLRAAKIRKVYSEGLIFDLDRLSSSGAAEFGIGVGMADYLEIGYHNPAPPDVVAPGQPQARRKDWRNSVKQYGVTSLRKAPDLFAYGEPVVITEKVHGTNFRFGWVKHGLKWHWLVGSHRTWKTDNRGWLARLFGRKPGPGWYGTDIWSEEAEHHALAGEADRFRGFVFYGELYGVTRDGKPIQDLTYGLTLAPGLRLFDAWDVKGNRFVPRTLLEDMAGEMGIPCVPVLAECGYSEATVRELAEGRSTLDKHTIREGVVVTSYDGERRGKWVSEGYRTRKDG